MKAGCDRRHCKADAVFHIVDKGTNWCTVHLPEKDKGRKLADKETDVIVYAADGFKY